MEEDNNKLTENNEEEVPLNVDEEIKEDTQVEVKEEPLEEKQDEIVTASIDMETEETKTEVDSIEGDYNGVNSTINEKQYKDLNVNFDKSHTIDETIENLRSKYAKNINGGKSFRIAFMGILLACFIGVILVVFLVKDESLSWIQWLVFGICIGVLVLFFIINKLFDNKSSKAAENYYYEFEETLNSFLFDDCSLENVKLGPKATIDNQKIIEAHYFSVITDIQSRAILLGKRNTYDVTFGEVCVLIPSTDIEVLNKLPEEYVNIDNSLYDPSLDKSSTMELPTNDLTIVDLELTDSVLDETGKLAKKREADIKKNEKKVQTPYGLFGRYLSYDEKVKSEESFIIAYLGDKENTCLPNYVKGFKPVHIDELRSNIVVYLAENSFNQPFKAGKFFTKENVELLNSIKVTQVLQSMFISVNSHGMKAGYRLSDDVMTLPLKEVKKTGSYDLIKEVIEKCFKFFDSVSSLKEAE